MWYLIWRTNKTFFSSASRHCLPITVFVLLMGDGVFSHTAENECEGEWENIDSPRLEASDARLDAAFAWNWCEKFWIFDGAAFGTFGKNFPSLSSKLGRDACKLSQAQKKKLISDCLRRTSITNFGAPLFIHAKSLHKKRCKFRSGSGVSKFFICGCIETCHIQASLPQKCSRTRSSASSKTMKQTISLKDGEKDETFAFLSLTTAKLFKLNNPSREKSLSELRAGAKKSAREGRKSSPCFPMQIRLITGITKWLY